MQCIFQFKLNFIFRRFCPVTRCNAVIPSEDSIIKISLSDDLCDVNYDSEEILAQGTEAKLVKRVQLLRAERDKLTENLEKTESEVEVYRSAFERIKFDLCMRFFKQPRSKITYLF